jgi:hypothetical protein
MDREQSQVGKTPKVFGNPNKITLKTRSASQPRTPSADSHPTQSTHQHKPKKKRAREASLARGLPMADIIA